MSIAETCTCYQADLSRDRPTRTNHPSTSPRRRPSLLELPTEVLSLIVDLCARQDRAFNHRQELLRRAPYQDPAVSRILHEQAGAGHEKTINRMFQTCRTLNKLASPHLFQTLRTSQLMTKYSKEYHYFIAPKHLQHFSQLVFDSADPAELDIVVASLNSFKRLNEITLESFSAELVFGENPVFELNLSHHPAISKWIEIAPQIRILHFDDFEPQVAANYVKSAPSLIHLHCIHRDPISGTDFDALVDVLPSLEHLHLDSNNKQTTECFAAALMGRKHDFPKLKRLTLTVPVIDSAILGFVRSLKSSLEELKMVVEGDDPDGDVADLADASCFPRLRSISIVGSSLLARCVFLGSSKALFPSLRHVCLSYGLDSNWGFGSDDDAFETIVKKHDLRGLQYLAQDRRYDSAEEAWMVRLAKMHGVPLELRDCPEVAYPSDIFLQNKYYARGTIFDDFVGGYNQEKVLKELETNMNQVVEYVGRTVERAIEYKDAPGLAQLATLLRPVEFERLAQFD